MRTLLVFYVTLTCISFSYGQQIPERPNPPRLVNDFAELLSAAEEQQLENKLKQYDDSTSTQIAIVTVKTLEGNDIAAYSFELGERWGIGQQGMDNGMLILVAPEEREIWIATGYGLEAFVPDAIAKRIVEKTIKPNFRNEDYYKGLDQATNIIMSLLSGEFAPDQIEEEVSIWPLLLLLGGFILVMYFISRGNKGGGGSYYDPDSRTYMGPYRGTSTWSDFSGGRGSFGGGSGSSGGGFGGFGGGGFGGGGAGGSW